MVNGLRGGRRRDAIERFSRIGEVALPAAMVLLMTPVVGGMAGVGAVAGWHIATNADHARLATAVASMLLLAPMAWLLMRPLLLAGQGGVERGELLRLLPVPTSFLRHLELLKVATDPILLIFAPALLCLPLGAFAAGRPFLGLAALGAALSFIAVLLGLGALVALATQLLLRNRRRGELAMLLFFLLLSVVGILPQLFDDTDRRPRAGATGPGAVGAGPRAPSPSRARCASSPRASTPRRCATPPRPTAPARSSTSRRSPGSPPSSTPVPRPSIAACSRRRRPARQGGAPQRHASGRPASRSWRRPPRRSRWSTCGR